MIRCVILTPIVRRHLISSLNRLPRRRSSDRSRRRNGGTLVPLFLFLLVNFGLLVPLFPPVPLVLLVLLHLLVPLLPPVLLVVPVLFRLLVPLALNPSMSNIQSLSRHWNLQLVLPQKDQPVISLFGSCLKHERVED